MLDFDYRHGAGDWERANLHRLPETRVHQSQSGGWHLLFVHAPGVRNSASKKGLARGVDVRGEGGYVIHPPSVGYRIISDAPIAHWPDWLLTLVLRPTLRPRPAGLAPLRPVSSDKLQQIIDDVLHRVRNAADGAKHFVLRNNALLLGGIADRAGLRDSDLVRQLLDALPANVADWDNARATAEWALENGRRNPVDLRDENNPKPGDPRRKETASLAFRMLRRRMPDADVIATLHARNRERTEPLPDNAVTATAHWAARQMKERA